MTDASRLQLELADALGVTQAVRAAAAAVGERAERAKLRRRMAAIDAELADLQEQLNALVVADPAVRERLTGRSRRLRDGEAVASRLADADELDALQALAAEAAYALSQWTVVRRLAKAERDKPARRLAKRALPLAEAHLERALKACDKAAKRRAAALADAD